MSLDLNIGKASKIIVLKCSCQTESQYEECYGTVDKPIRHSEYKSENFLRIFQYRSKFLVSYEKSKMILDFPQVPSK